MPKFKYDGPMPTEQQTPRHDGGGLQLRDVLTEVAIHFGWESWDHYHKNNYHHAKKIKQDVYDMSYEDKQNMLRNIREAKEK